MNCRQLFWVVGFLALSWCFVNVGRTAVDPVESSAPQAAPQARTAHPNIIFILTDDMALHDVEFMPKLKKLLVEEGTTVSNYFVTNSQCCPSRSSILRGQYVHNHGVESNSVGFKRFYRLGNEASTVGTWLRAAGYRTGYMGKYLNGYPDAHNKIYMPPGWDEWFVAIGGGGYKEFDYILNENGKLVKYGRADHDYLTDVIAAKTVGFIEEAVEKKKPFFLHLAPFAPHEPSVPAPRHQTLFTDATAPRTASFNSKNVSSKPAYIRALPLLSQKEIAKMDQLYRRRLQSLQAVDEMIKKIIETLERTGELRHTYIVFSSDNGFHLGQHRLLQGKQTPYDEDIRVPLIIRGPDVPAHRSITQLAVETDLAATFADWASVVPPGFVDGRSLEPLLKKSLSPSLEWREGVLIEHQPGHEPFMSWFEKRLFMVKDKPRLTGYRAVRSSRYLFVQYQSGEREFYDLLHDPDELYNIVAKVDPIWIKRYSLWLDHLSNCKGPDCRSAENARFGEMHTAP
ncbi:MAG TPA: sulfatase [Candidatus Binatia bacterium]|nr:sulfatase [Candidatus Binatia bacterium]